MGLQRRVHQFVRMAKGVIAVNSSDYSTYLQPYVSVRSVDCAQYLAVLGLLVRNVALPALHLESFGPLTRLQRNCISLLPPSSVSVAQDKLRVHSDTSLLTRIG